MEITVTLSSVSQTEAQPCFIVPQLTEEQVLRDTSWRMLDNDIGCREMAALYWQEDRYSSLLAYRISAINEVIDHICQHYQRGVVNLVSFGSGGGLHEYYVLQLLLSAQVEVELTLIDPIYSNAELKQQILSCLTELTGSDKISAWVSEQQFLNRSTAVTSNRVSAILCNDRPQFKHPHALPENVLARINRQRLDLTDIQNSALYPIGMAVELEHANALYCLFDRKENMARFDALPGILKSGVTALASTSAVLFYLNGEKQVRFKPSLEPEVYKYMEYFQQVTRNATSLATLNAGFRKVLKRQEARQFFSQYAMFVIPFADYDAGLINLVQHVAEKSDRLIIAELNNNQLQLHINVVN